MPRPNPTRVLGNEKTLASRIRWEREGKEYTYEGLASRMTAAGCPIQPSAIYKIEKAEPPRRITVDELVALSTVFDLPIPELLLPPEVAADRDLRKLLEAWRKTRAAESEAFHALTNYVLAHPDLEDAVEALLNDEDREALVEVAMKGLDRMRRSGALKDMAMPDMKKASEAQKKKGGRRRG